MNEDFDFKRDSLIKYASCKYVQNCAEKLLCTSPLSTIMKCECYVLVRYKAKANKTIYFSTNMFDLHILHKLQNKQSVSFIKVDR